MSIGLIKRLLSLANLLGVVVIALAVWGFWQHRQGMKVAYKTPVFVSEVKAPPLESVRIEAITMQLGRFPKAVEKGPESPPEEKVPDIETFLNQLGTITNAVVAYPPYAGVWPTISFELKKPLPGGEKVLVLRLGEALVTKRGESDLDLVPHRYKFIRCEPDPEHPSWTYFVFDVNCDGKEEQKTRWKLEDQEKSPWPGADADKDEGLRSVKTNRVLIRREGEEPPPKPREVQPVEPGPAPVAPQPVSAVPSDLFESQQGTFEPTREGAEWLKSNYESLIGDVKGSTWRDPKTGRPAGIQVTRIRAGSVATKFGIRTTDVILAVNDRPVTSKDQAMKVVKEELKKPNNHIIRVKILRLGAQKILRFDSRDPATRRAARDAMR